MPGSDKRRVSAQVSAAPRFADCLLAVHAFLVEQDAASASVRLSQLKRDLREMKTMLAWSPASGRPARFLKPNSAQASLRLAAVQQLAQSAGLPHLREFVIGSHLVLYAHSDTEVILLSIKHHRQLTYITLQRPLPSKWLVPTDLSQPPASCSSASYARRPR